MKIIFAGTPELALPCLQALIDSTHEVTAVYTQPDRPAGRGQKLQQSPVKTLALTHHIPIEQPTTFNKAALAQLASYQADIMIVIAYGLLLPEAVLNTFPLGCINPHVSLLPRWRGAAPIQRAIEAGDTVTGVTLIQMDKGWDTGDMLAKKSISIDPANTSEEIHHQLAQIAAELLLETLPKLQNHTIQPEKQNHSKSTHAKKLSKEEALINWQDSAFQIDRKIHAFNPWPVAFCYFNNDIMRLWQSEVLDQQSTEKPGTIIQASKNGLDIACGAGVLRLLEIQLPGGKRISTRDFYNAKGAQLNHLVLTC